MNQAISVVSSDFSNVKKNIINSEIKDLAVVTDFDRTLTYGSIDCSNKKTERWSLSLI